MFTVLRHLFFFVIYGLLGLVVGVFSFYALQMNSRPDLDVWHTARLDAEFRARDADSTPDLASYLARENRLFAQLNDRVYARVPLSKASVLNRYWAGSLVDPRLATVNWNHTVVLRAKNPRGAALLLHGLSDSPYSMRAMAEHLQAQGWSVVALRLPGNGTAPLGLLDVEWQDWAAASRVAARDLVKSVGAEKPFLLVGYSMGAAVALEYALAQRQGESLPKPRALVLVSPAVSVSGSARFASWQKNFARVPGLQKLAWVDLLPEFDAYKYGSFAVNAGDQIWRLTRHLDQQMSALAESDGIHGLPPILTFQSIADATVSAPAVVDTLYSRLASGGHALVMFDANRLTSTRSLLRSNLFAARDDLLKSKPQSFDLTVLSNADENNLALAAWQRAANSSVVTRTPTDMVWPAGVFSLSHVALPIAPNDPLYGDKPPLKSGSGIYLGRLSLLGEKGQLAVPETQLMRLRYNPFFSYLLQRLDSFVQPLLVLPAVPE